MGDRLSLAVPIRSNAATTIISQEGNGHGQKQ
jgi:hypothetical protein